MLLIIYFIAGGTIITFKIISIIILIIIKIAKLLVGIIRIVVEIKRQWKWRLRFYAILHLNIIKYTRETTEILKIEYLYIIFSNFKYFLKSNFLIISKWSRK